MPTPSTSRAAGRLGREARGDPHRLAPAEARAVAARLLIAGGYRLAGRADTGDSAYFEIAGLAGRIRVSNHRTSPARRGRLPGPTVSVVIGDCLSQRQVEARVAGACAEHARVGARP